MSKGFPFSPLILATIKSDKNETGLQPEKMAEGKKI
jgi:hypothetical protein